HREAAALAHEALAADGGAADAIGAAVAAVTGHGPLADAEQRLRALAAEAADIAAELRDAADSLEDDPERLAAVTERRHLLHDLRRKYGETLADVIAFADEARTRLAELVSYDARAAGLESERAAAVDTVEAVEAEIGA